MANRIAIAATVATIAVGLASCSLAETPEQCAERFAGLFPSERLFGNGVGRSTLTYRLPDDFKIPEFQPDAVRPSNGEGPTFTLGGGTGTAAFDNFSRQDVPDRGAYLGFNGVTYFRMKGPVGTPKDGAAAGCADGPKGSQLIRIDWAPEPGKRPSDAQAD